MTGEFNRKDTSLMQMWLVEVTPDPTRLYLLVKLNYKTRGYDAFVNILDNGHRIILPPNRLRTIRINLSQGLALIKLRRVRDIDGLPHGSAIQ